jgi:hypothetical protein
MFRGFMREYGWIWVSRWFQIRICSGKGRGLTDGRRAAAIYTKLSAVIIQPQTRAAIVGRISKFKGHRARPAFAHWEVLL